MSPGDVPRDLIPRAVLIALNQRGRTIRAIEVQQNRRYGGDGLQKGYANRPVWHRRLDLIRSVAETLKISPSVWGPDRTSAHFHNYVDQEIAKLRKRGTIADWNGTEHLGIFRLTLRPDRLPRDLKMSMDVDAPIRPPKQVRADTETNLKRAFLSILTRGRKDNTYKFALARVLLDYCRENKANPRGRYEIPYEYLSGKFLKYYWYQEYKFKIKQDFRVRGRPRVISAIRDVFGDDVPGDFDLLDRDDIKKAEKRILQTVFGHARQKMGLVVPRFQNIPRGKYAEEARTFYDYSDDEKKIYLKPEAFEFFSSNYGILSRAVLAEWAKFLEKVNNSLPRLVAKIERYDMQRGSLLPFRKMYLEHAAHCFYCAGRLERSRIHVDHLIPWSYLFDDNAWNLVLACPECNCKKSNSLPQEEFRSSLIKRNTRYYDSIGELRNSLKLLDAGNGWKTAIENHYENCRDYGFAQIHLP